MSRAFTRLNDDETNLADIGERPVSPHRNLVTSHGMELIDMELAALREEFVKAEISGERERLALVSRDLRYWTARRESAEVSTPDPDSKLVRFGMTVIVEDDEGQRRTWKIVGEDEADAAHGTISHVSPMAQALFGKGAGDSVTVSGREWEIVALELD